LWVSTSWFEANQHYRRVVSEIKQLSHSGDIQDHLIWRSAKSKIIEALAKRKNAPIYEYRLGRLYEYRAADPYARDEQKILDRDHALNYYDRVVRQRPTWTMGWASLAYLRALSIPANSLADSAYKTALKRAGHERRAQRLNMITGMIRWGFLDQLERINLTKEAHELMQDAREVNNLISTATGMGWIDRLRPIAEDVLGVDNFNARLRRINKRK